MDTQQLQLPITGMTCASCVSRGGRALGKVDGVLSPTVNLATEEATVTTRPDTNWETLKAAVERVGYGVIEVQDEAEGQATSDSEAEARAAELARKRRQLV